MDINYLQELRDATNLLDVGDVEKVANEEPQKAQEAQSPNTETCTELAQDLLKTAAEMRGDTPKGGAPSDTETTASIDEATGISEEELKRRLAERLKKKRQQEAGPEKPKGEAMEEGGEGAEGAEDKEAAASDKLPPNSAPYPKEVGKLLAESPSDELTEADLKKGLALFMKGKSKGGKK
jgi:hypothetical protein